MPADRKICRCPCSDEFYERLFPRTDVGNKNPQLGPVHRFSTVSTGSAYWDNVLQILPALPGDGPVHQFRACKEIPAETVDQRRPNAVSPPVMQHVKVSNRDFSAASGPRSRVGTLEFGA